MAVLVLGAMWLIKAHRDITRRIEKRNRQAANNPARLRRLDVRFGGAQLVAVTLVAAFTVLNFFGVGRVARVQNTLTGAKITMLIVFIGMGLLVGAGNWKHFSMPTSRLTTNSLQAQFAISLFWIYLAYSDWNAATYIAEELKQPSKTLPLALACGAA